MLELYIFQIFFIAQMLLGKFCLFNSISIAFLFLRIYHGQLFWLSIICPIIIICITIGVIIHQIAISAKMRRHFNGSNTNAYKINDFLERRSTLISISLIYTVIFQQRLQGGGDFPPGLSSPPPEKFPLNAIRLWHSSKPRRLTIPPTTTNLT